MNNKAAQIFFAGLLFLAGCARQVAPTPTTTAESVSQTDVPTLSPSATPAGSDPTEMTNPTKTPTPSPTAASRPYMGIQVIRMDLPPQADLFQESGAEWSRHDYLRWEEIEPENLEEKDFHWDTVREDMLLAAVEGGQQTITIILFTPAWAQKYPGYACGPIAEDALNDFAEFIGAVVRRYSVPPYNLKYWEIGNEPDIAWGLVKGNSGYGCWGELDDPYYGGGYYAEMLKQVYPVVRAADPESRLIVGGLVLDCDPVNPPETQPNSGDFRDCTSAKFLEGIFEAGGGEYFDGVSFHAYDYYYGEEGSYGNEGWHSSSDTTGPVLLAKTRYLRSLLNSYGYPEKELLNTELAVLCGRSGEEDFCLGDPYANTKSSYISQANTAALAAGIHVNLWYSLTGWRGTGLVSKDIQPLPAYDAYQFAASILNEAVYLDEIDEYTGVMGYSFKSVDGQYWVVWSLDGDNHTINLPDNPLNVYDVYGRPVLEKVLSKSGLDVTVAPVFIRWAP